MPWASFNFIVLYVESKTKPEQRQKKTISLILHNVFIN